MTALSGTTLGGRINGLGSRPRGGGNRVTACYVRKELRAGIRGHCGTRVDPRVRSFDQGGNTKESRRSQRVCREPEISDARHHPLTIIDLVTLPCTTPVTRATNPHYTLISLFPEACPARWRAATRREQRANNLRPQRPNQAQATRLPRPECEN